MLLLLPAAIAFGGLSGSYIIPLDHPAIQYSKVPAQDVVSQLAKRIQSGEVQLQWESELGYLRSILKELKVPEASQVLVFSKTSFQAPRISPRMPRALYFNDQVQVGYVRTGDVLEFAAVDGQQGISFYTLGQEKVAKPQLERNDSCLQCHQSGGTLGVPGLLVRSVFPDRTGMPVFHAGTFVTDHRSPMKERWGGWYVTGTTGQQTHMGNSISDADGTMETLGGRSAQNLLDLRGFIDTGAYLTPHSDVVALMTLEHQTRMLNLFTRVGWETRMALYDNDAMNKALGQPANEISESTNRRINSAVDELLQYMLFRDETLITEPVKGTSGFAEQFAKSGLHDRQGRSLRDFDLKTRLFRYPCSYLIYSDAFEAMPAQAKDRILKRLYAILSGQGSDPLSASIPPEQRQATLAILRETKKNLPAYWIGTH